MAFGEAAGAAAGLAMKANIDLSEVNVVELQSVLIHYGAVIAIP
jgi:hypothetical protein